MMVYTFWNNKGGTGKTTLCFQTILLYASQHMDQHILAIDLCPQANLSEFLFGGMTGHGAHHLDAMYQKTPRCSIGGYFEYRFNSPFQPIDIKPHDFISKPSMSNSNVPQNVDLIAGDRLVELQSSPISGLSTTQVPKVRPYACILSWLKDLLVIVQQEYDIVFVDTNPSFSIYTQIALAATENLIIPVMADESSKRALYNVLALVYGIQLPPTYADNAFYTEMQTSGLQLPKIHSIIKNRLTQYMGPASAYQSVLQSIDNLVSQLKAQNGDYFSQSFSIQEVRDFQTTGVVAHAEAKSFVQLGKEVLTHVIDGKKTKLDKDYIKNNADDIEKIVNCL